MIHVFTKPFIKRSCLYMLLALAGCAPLKKGELPEKTRPMTERQKEAHVHWLYGIVPQHRSLIRPYDIGHTITWALFGNDDAGIFAESEKQKIDGYEDRPITTSLAIRWFLRNPFHNFTGYVIGSQGKKQDEFVLFAYNKKGATVTHSEKKASSKHHDDYFFFGFHSFKPFFSITIPLSQGKVSRFYLGWRSHGSFGLKLNLISQYTPKKDLDEEGS
jgi:hypothetical protein